MDLGLLGITWNEPPNLYEKIVLKEPIASMSIMQIHQLRVRTADELRGRLQGNSTSSLDKLSGNRSRTSSTGSGAGAERISSVDKTSSIITPIKSSAPNEKNENTITAKVTVIENEEQKIDSKDIRFPDTELPPPRLSNSNGINLMDSKSDDSIEQIGTQIISNWSGDENDSGRHSIFQRLSALKPSGGSGKYSQSDCNIELMKLILEDDYDIVVKYIDDHDADINRDYQDMADGNTPIINACHIANIRTLQLLISKGMNMNKTDNHGKTAIDWASTHGQVEILKILIDAKGRLDEKLAVNQLSLDLIHAIEHKDLVKAANLINNDGIDLNYADKSRNTPLICASKFGYNTIVGKLIEKKGFVLVNACDNNKTTAINWACQNGHLDVVKLLIKGRADINIADADGLTPLSWASTKGYSDIVKLLLDSKADVNKGNKDGNTPLHKASFYGNAEIVSMLLNDPNTAASSPNKLGQTAIFSGASSGNTNVVNLFQLDVNEMNQGDKDGRTAIFSAVSNGQIDMGLHRLRLILIKYFSISDAFSAFPGMEMLYAVYGNTPIIYASQQGSAEIVKILIDDHADISATNNESLLLKEQIINEKKCVEKDLEESLLKLKAALNDLEISDSEISVLTQRMELNKQQSVQMENSLRHLEKKLDDECLINKQQKIIFEEKLTHFNEIIHNLKVQQQKNESNYEKNTHESLEIIRHKTTLLESLSLDYHELQSKYHHLEDERMKVDGLMDKEKKKCILLENKLKSYEEENKKKIEGQQSVINELMKNNNDYQS
eukprot:gene10894-14623_t